MDADETLVDADGWRHSPSDHKVFCARDADCHYVLPANYIRIEFTVAWAWLLAALIVLTILGMLGHS